MKTLTLIGDQHGKLLLGQQTDSVVRRKGVGQILTDNLLQGCWVSHC